MNTRFGILAGLAPVMFIAMLVLSAISPLGVQGADQPAIAGDGQGVGFQQSSMVANVTVTNTPNGLGKQPGTPSRS